jgi:hypothetical protein
MQRLRFIALSLAGLIIAAAAPLASDRVAVYARVDRVVLGPDASTPQTIQIFGVFSLAKPNNPNDYEAPAKGYLYFTLAGDERLARREWTDLKAIAGTRQIVAFGNRYLMKARLRADTAAPSEPDAYTTDSGLTKINGSTDYAPVRGLIDFRN